MTFNSGPQVPPPPTPQQPTPYQADVFQAAPPGVGQPYPAVYAVKPPLLASAVVALCLGIAGLLLLWVPFLGWLLGIAAVIVGHVSVSHIQRSVQPRSGKGLAIGGLVTGYFAGIVGTFFFIATILVAVSDTTT